MKKLFCLFALLAASCSQGYIDQKAAERDHAWCESMGVKMGAPQYQDCRVIAARNRQIEEQNRTAVGLGMMGYGAAIQNSRPTYTPPPFPVTCVRQGVFTTCQ